MKKKHPTASVQTRMMKPNIGSAITSARLLMPPPGVAEGDIRSTVEDGSSDVLKMRLGLIGNAWSVGVLKWQLYRRASRTTRRPG
jgi:hypothetical protein